MKTRFRALTIVVVIGLGLVIGGLITPGEATTSATRPAGAIQPNIYFLIPTSVSLSISVLNGTATLVVAQIAEDLTNFPPIANVSVSQKDIVTFGVPARGYYNVQFLDSNGNPTAVTYTLSEGGQPSDLVFFGSVVLIVGLVGASSAMIVGRRRQRIPGTGKPLDRSHGSAPA